MSIQGEIDRLSAAKASIAASLQAMGIEPPEGTTLEQAKKSPIGFAHLSWSIPGSPHSTPIIQPTFPTLQSVSQPHILQIHIVLVKSPAP